MSTTLHNCGRLEVRNSPIEGFGVFATDDIKQGEVLEEVPFVLFPRYTALGHNLYNMLNATGFISDREKHYEHIRKTHKFKEPEKYYFKWIPSAQPEGASLEYMVLPLGYGPIYNTANANNNAGWKIAEKTFLFTAEKNISKGDEIRSFYGYFLGEEGTIWNADQVFHLAFDKNLDGAIRLLALRFQTPELIEKAKTIPTFTRLQELLNSNLDGLRLVSLSLAMPDGSERNKTDIPANATVSFIYQRLAEYHRISSGNRLNVVAEIEFVNKESKTQIDKFQLRLP